MRQEDLNEIFLPYYTSKIKAMQASEDNFAYYSNLATLHSILKNKEIWFRNISCMNDFSEVQYGMNLMKKFILNDKEKHRRIISLLNEIIKEENCESFLEEFFEKTWLMYPTYIACLSQHDSAEDNYGRLSMWRAYGRGNGAALVLDKDKVFDNDNYIDGVYLSPVLYCDENAFNKELDDLIDKIEKNKLKLKEYCNTKVIKNMFFSALIFAVVSIKHPGFKEESEWRLVYFQNSQESVRFKQDIECISGIPQNVYKLQLNGKLKDLIKHIIIGPTQYSLIAYNSVVECLKKELHVNNAEDRVRVSDIPIRPEYV